MNRVILAARGPLMANVMKLARGCSCTVTNLPRINSVRHNSSQESMSADPRIHSEWPQRTTAKFKRLARDAGASTYRGRKRTNEDRFVISDINIRKEAWLCAAVFDGHGGQAAAEFASKNYLRILNEHLQIQPSIPKALDASFLELDAQFSATSEATEKGFVGSTGTVAVVNGSDLHVAWVGDSPAVLYYTNGEYDELLIPHNPRNPVEKARVEEQGGTIVRVGGVQRLNGASTVTRAIGDVSLKNLGMIACPAIQHRQINNGNSFLLLGSDGLFDGMDRESIFQMVKGSRTPQEAVRRMEIEAEIGGSMDNITAIVVPLDGWFPMLTPIEDGPTYKFLSELASKGGRGQAHQLDRFITLLRAYLPNRITDDQLLEMKNHFMRTGRGDFGLAAFKVFDEDGDGAISFEEFWNLYQLVGSPFSRTELRRMFELADQDGDGGIGLGEFRQTMRALLLVAHNDSNPHTPL
eukprot:CFRG5895T1